MDAATLASPALDKVINLVRARLVVRANDALSGSDPRHEAPPSFS